MEVDTGAAFSLISEASFRDLWPCCKLDKVDICLCTYSGEFITVLGSTTVSISYKSQQATVPLLVVKGEGPTLFGRNWLQSVILDWQEINYMHEQSPLSSVLRSHEAVFQGGLGTLKGQKAKILVDPQAQPLFFKAWSIPYAFRPLVEEEL